MASLLIVDDDRDGRVALCEFLQRQGHRVAGVPGGRAALKSFLAHVPDLLILDLLLPDMDGDGLLQAVRSGLKLWSLPVVVLTGLPDGPIADRARELRVDAVLTKASATFEDILGAVEDALHGARASSVGAG